MSTRYDLIVDQGSNYEITIPLTDSDGIPWDLTGMVVTGGFQKYFKYGNVHLFDIATSLGSITLSLSANQTNAIDHGKYVYTVNVATNSNNTIRLIEGIVFINPGVNIT